ncbi:TPA: ATP-binding cassette domain-containing protein, partial [Clostridioides difficile]|nr:ATP-binding cassette domain-containing protein [Clostridioides difficile]
MTPIIQFKNIKKQYNDKTIIDNLNLDIEKGEFLTVIGSSGSGKTTLLKMINGLILPDGGNILINQTDIKNEDLIKLRR